ncbi:MAG: DUF2062 domain-containing protein [Opitutaceae bacterium]|nr:DUF2062 domain-containing protein [Cephaloticoccus sp.]MCP5529602.1 DUF2062 domain-containing protein [Opitutaceae bacterium]
MTDDHSRRDRHARFRLWKQVLRFVPRRAAFHRYPLVGRFAEVARKRSFLWSFKLPHLRPAFYAGSILAVMPVMGVQVPAAFILALLLRANFMVLGGLQFVTNPVTAAPIYYATHQLGKNIIHWSGFGDSIPIEEELTDPTSVATINTFEPPPDPNQIEEEMHWGRRIGSAINALVIGGAVIGTLLGAALDFSWRILTERFGPQHLHRRRASRSTRPTGPPK